MTKDKLPAFEHGWQHDDKCAEMVALARCVLVCTKEPSGSVRVNFVYLARYLDPTHGFDVRQYPLIEWVKVEFEVFREHLACETVALVVDAFGTVAVVSGEAGGVERSELLGVGIGEVQVTAEFGGYMRVYYTLRGFLNLPIGLRLRIETALSGWYWRSGVGDPWVSDVEGEGFMTKAADRRVYLFECTPEALDNLTFFGSQRRAKVGFLHGGIRGL